MMRQKISLTKSTPAATIDKSFCLNLDSMPERWNRFKASISTSRILSRAVVNRYRATPVSELIIPDYWKHLPSHYATRFDFLDMIRKAYASNARSLLIFEDDVIITPDFDLKFSAAVSDLPSNWKGLWLSTHPNYGRPPTSPLTSNINRLHGCLSTHAVLLSRTGMHRVYSHVSHQVAILSDWATKELHGMEKDFYITTKDIALADGTRTK